VNAPKEFQPKTPPNKQAAFFFIRHLATKKNPQCELYKGVFYFFWVGGGGFLAKVAIF